MGLFTDKDMMFGSGLGFAGLADLMVQLSNFRNPRWQPSWINKNGHNFATCLPINAMFGSRVSLDFFARGFHTH